MINPILERELKTKSRTKKMPVTISLYLGILALFSYAIFTTTVSIREGINPSSIIEAFDITVVIQLIMIMTVTPMLTATSISGERDRQTLDLMLCTDISPWTIIFGKIYAALSTVLLLIVLSLPILSIVFILGGGSLLDMLIIMLYYIASAFAISSVSIYSSTKYKKNITAIVMTYVILFIIYVLPFIFTAILGSILPMYNYQFVDTVIEPNSYIFASLIFGWNPGYGVVSLLNNDFLFHNLQNSASAMPFFESVRPWVISLVLMSILSFIMLRKAKKHLTKKE